MRTQLWFEPGKIMSEELNDGALRLAVAQICQSMGWDALNKSTHDLLTDVLQRYMLEIAKCAHEYSQLYCHTEPSLDDLGLAFKQTGVLLHELEDYVSQVDQVPFSYQLPQFPMPKPNQLQHPRKEDILDRPEFYNDHLPPLIKALQQTEDEREGSKEESAGAGVDDPSSQSFLRNEIKTVGKETENEPTENFPDKRSLVISPPDLETESKRRRVEKENNLDILQVLQEKNNITSSSPISPDLAPETLSKPLFTFTSASTPTPPIRGSTKKPKADKSTKQKKLLSPPKPKSTKQSSPSKKKTPDKSKPKDETSNKNVDTTITSPPLQKTSPFSKPKTPKKSKTKVKTPEKKTKLPEPTIIPSLTVNPVPTNTNQKGSQPMPKLIIKPMKLEKNQSTGYSVSAVPLDKGLVTENIDTLKSSTPKTDEYKPKKKKKKKDSTVVPSSGIDLLLQVPLVSPDIPSTSTGALNPLIMDNIVEPVKKKKKRHKEKGKDKNKPKKVKDVSSPDPSTHIPTIKLKLENTPTTTIPSKTIPIEKISVTTSEPAIIKPKEVGLPDLQRTVITETLSTTVAPVQVYYCPACGLADDGSFMIGCDTCDSWYHGACVGVIVDPGGDWFCNPCLTKKAKKKKKKKKTKANE